MPDFWSPAIEAVRKLLPVGIPDWMFDSLGVFVSGQTTTKVPPLAGPIGVRVPPILPATAATARLGITLQHAAGRPVVAAEDVPLRVTAPNAAVT
jgi:hypothetical protein